MQRIPLFIILMSLMFFGCADAIPTPAAATEALPSIEISVTSTITEAATSPVPPAPVGWLTYENSTYGFYFYHPVQFEVLMDEATLYGWENAILLLYNGGQSYDIAVQVWDSTEDMKASYGGEDERLHAYPLGNQIISVMNITNEADSEAIIASFTIR